MDIVLLNVAFDEYRNNLQISLSVLIDGEPYAEGEIIDGNLIAPNDNESGITFNPTGGGNFTHQSQIDGFKNTANYPAGEYRIEIDIWIVENGEEQLINRSIFFSK